MIPVLPFERQNALRYGLYFAARLLPHPRLRSGVVAGIRLAVNARHKRAPQPPSPQAQTALAALRSEGLAFVPSPLTAEQIDDIMAFLQTAPAAQGAGGKAVTLQSQGVSSAVYDLPTIVACPHLLQAMNHPDMLQIAEGFLGCKPTLSGAGLRWSFPSDDAQSIEVQKFHRDAEDWKILRLFIYLTDVDPECGPHQFIRQSHKTGGRFRLQPYTDEFIDAHFGRDKVETIHGLRGTAFMGNMWGVHRGVPPSGRPRLLFNCTYTMTGTPIFRYDPVSVADRHLYDGYTNRLLLA